MKAKDEKPGVYVGHGKVLVGTITGHVLMKSSIYSINIMDRYLICQSAATFIQHTWIYLTRYLADNLINAMNI